MREFYKMSGSGNDFVFIDARHGDAEAMGAPERIRQICARGTGGGADGIVFVGPAPAGADIGIRYYNADGSLGELCGNATLCTMRLATELGVGTGPALRIATDSGVMTARMAAGLPEFDLGTVTRVESDAPIERQAVLLEVSAFADFLVEQIPLMRQEWEARREELVAEGRLPAVSHRPGADRR